MTDYKELRRLAEAYQAAEEAYLARNSSAAYMDAKDAGTAFSAAASPSVVLALLEEIEGLRKDAARYRWLRDSPIQEDAQEWICAGLFDMGGASELDGKELDKAIDAAMSPQEKEEGK